MRKFQASLVFHHVQSAVYCPSSISLKNYSVVLWLKAVLAVFPDFILFSIHIHVVLSSFFRISTVEISAVGNSNDILKLFSFSKFSSGKNLLQLIEQVTPLPSGSFKYLLGK